MIRGRDGSATAGRGRIVAIVNPQIIIEVLSASTATRDLGEKLDD